MAKLKKVYGFCNYSNFKVYPGSLYTLYVPKCAGGRIMINNVFYSLFTETPPTMRSRAIISITTSFWDFIN